MTIQRRLRYSVTEALRIAEFCSNSAGSVCRFWHCQSSDPPVHPLDIPLDITRIPLRWFETHWSVFQGGLGRGGIQSTSIGHWGSSGVSSWTPPLLHIDYITGSHHTGTWLLLPLLCWWHTAVSLISTWWSNGSCTDLRLPGGHLGMDERISPTAQPGKDWSLTSPCHTSLTLATSCSSHPVQDSCILAYRTTTGSAPAYLHSLLRIYIPSRSLRSASERRLVVPSQRGSKSLSRTFSFTVPGRWNDLPPPSGNAGSLSIFKQQLKTHLFQLYLTSS